MSLTATYDGVLSRIRLSATLLGATATYAVFERTTNGINYTTVRGGSAVAVASENASVDDYEFPTGVEITYRVTSFNASDVQQAQYTTTITQDLDGPWLKVPAAPFLNTEVVIVDRPQIGRRDRGGTFDIVGRTLPVHVGDVKASRQWILTLLTETPSAASDLDFLFLSGEILFLQLPSATTLVPGGYYAAGDVEQGQATTRLSPRALWVVPLTEVAAPGPEVVGSAYTWTSVLADYATWSALIADNLTWADLLERTGTPSDVIVP